MVKNKRALLAGFARKTEASASAAAQNPADLRRNLHGSRGEQARAEQAPPKHQRERPAREDPRSLRSRSAPPTSGHQECLERCQVVRFLVGDQLNPHECPLGRIRPDGSLDIEDLALITEGNETSTMNLDDGVIPFDKDDRVIPIDKDTEMRFEDSDSD